MSDERSSPGVGPLTWLTLGLLFFSWATIGGLMARVVIRFFPFSASEAATFAGTTALVLGSYLLWGYAAWRGRRMTGPSAAAYVFAWLCAMLTLIILGSAVSPSFVVVLEESGVGFRDLEFAAYLLWGAGVLTGLPTAVAVRRAVRSGPNDP